MCACDPPPSDTHGACRRLLQLQPAPQASGCCHRCPAFRTRLLGLSPNAFTRLLQNRHPHITRQRLQARRPSLRRRGGGQSVDAAAVGSCCRATLRCCKPAAASSAPPLQHLTAQPSVGVPKSSPPTTVLAGERRSWPGEKAQASAGGHAAGEAGGRRALPSAERQRRNAL